MLSRILDFTNSLESVVVLFLSWTVICTVLLVVGQQWTSWSPSVAFSHCMQSVVQPPSAVTVCGQKAVVRVGKLDKILNHDKQMGDEEKIRCLSEEFVHRELPEKLQCFLSDIHLLFGLHFCSRYSLMWCHNCVGEHHLTHHSQKLP